MKTAEEIIISKRFFELSPAEREAVKEYASNEEDYEAMRWFLISAGNSFAQEKIEPSAQLRKNVLTHLNQKQAAPKTIWLNGAGAFLFPSEKPFYRYPAFQMAAVAAVIVSVVMVYNTSPMQDAPAELAINEQQKGGEQIPAEQPVTATTLPMETESKVAEKTEEAARDQNKWYDQQGASGSSTGPALDNLALEDLTKTEEEANVFESTDDADYEKMSVAEEVKLSSEADELKEAPAQQQVTQNEIGFYPNNGVYNVASSERFGSGVKLDFTKDELSKDKKKTEDDGSVRTESANTETTTTGGYVNVAPASGSTTVTSTNGDTDGAGYLFKNTNGTVVVNNDSTVTRIADLDKQADAKFSVNETTALKKLFKVMR